MEKNKRRQMWRLEQKADSSALDLYIYDDVEEDYSSWWSDCSCETSAKFFREQLSEHPDAQQINVYINSYGGSVSEGTAIYNQLRRHPAHKTIYVDGFACSIASVIAMAGDTVVMPRNTMMMIHNMWTYAAGNSAELRKVADDLDIINAAGRQAYLAKSGGKITEDKLIELMDAETWLTAEECLAYGFADEISDTEADLSAAKQLLQKANMSLQQSIDQHKALSAQLQQMAAKPAEPTPAPVPPQQKDTNKFMALLGRK